MDQEQQEQEQKLRSIAKGNDLGAERTVGEIERGAILCVVKSENESRKKDMADKRDPESRIPSTVN